MQNAKALYLTSVICVIGALVANHAIGRISVAPLRRLPVDTFPRVFHGWQGSADRPVDPEVRRKLPTAAIVDRDYRDRRGRTINLTLLTATEYADFHDPRWCFPAQGFTLSPTREVTVGKQSARMMTAERDGARMLVLFWWKGQVISEIKWGREQIGKLMALRNKLTNEQGQSLYVRLIAPDAPGSEKLLMDFANHMQPEMDRIEREGAEPHPNPSP